MTRNPLSDALQPRPLTALILMLYSLALHIAPASAVKVTPPGEPLSIADGYWDSQQIAAVLDRTVLVHLDPSLDQLGPAERDVVDCLLQVGEIFQRLYEGSQHRQAQPSLRALQALHEQGRHPELSARLLDLYWLFDGPIATTLDNERMPFMPVEPEQPGRNVYPWRIEHEQIERYLRMHPEQRADLLHPRSVVRRANADMLRHDLETLDTHPVLDLLHPQLRERFQRLLNDADDNALYAVPYSIAYAEDLLQASKLVRKAAAHAERVDPDFAQYLRLRALDLLSDDYEGGDAAWVRGHFGRLNVQIGSYETYDDKLYGTKTFFGLSLLLRDDERSASLAHAVAGLQALQDALPYQNDKRIREDIPVGVYSVIADFGQARGTNTATILPNEADHARKYGRTILIRHNILTNEELFRDRRAAFAAALHGSYLDDLTLDSGFRRTLWHEVGHYLGPDLTADGRNLDDALGAFADLYEELKADLVSLFAARHLHRAGMLDAQQIRGFYADGILRTLQKVRPLPGQPYQNMQLIQMNHFLESGVLKLDDAGRLHIDYERYHDAVVQLLRTVIGIQLDGDALRAGEFVRDSARWDADLHGALARRIDASISYRYRLVRYGVLEASKD